MQTNILRAATLLACLLLSASSRLNTCFPQSLSSPPSSLEKAIRARARQDAQNRKQMAGAQDLDLLFGREAASQHVELMDVVSIYEDAYKKSQPETPWYEVFKPSAGWIAAVIFFVLLILQEAVRKRIAAWVEATLGWLYYRLVGFKFFRKKVLRKYRAALVKKYQHFPIAFGSERTLDMKKVYVPLKVKGGGAEEQLEDVRLLSSYKRLMVVGAPGSGKSMFLKRIAFLYATGNLTNLPETCVPVLFELRRLNEKDKSLEEHLVEIFALNGFKDAHDFVNASLEEGTLLLLFDGLDEVNSSKRKAEVLKINDLLDKHEECPALITCRTAVYRDEFAGSVERTLEIQEFSDSQIYQFLESWPNMKEGKSIDELMKNLRERPRIMALARNPLLLTIVTFLYSDKPEFVLPHYRTDFYDRAVNDLLKNKETLNTYEVAPKYYVLQQLALFNQEQSLPPFGGEAENDRLSIDVETVLVQINKVLPRLTLKPEDALPLLKEIVERSGLLLELDNQTRYQFSHLTLQEYFAASVLAKDSQRLLRNFAADRDAWRETVKLWCGQIHDSTELVKTINEVDPVIAFECLADARVVDPGEAELIVNAFKPQLRDGSENKDIVRAFAAVAAGTSERSHYVFDFLAQTLDSPPDAKTFATAAAALGGTNKPAAVAVLAERLSNNPPVQTALIDMGDLSVQTLAQLAAEGDTICVEMLHSIGTPQAAKALVPLLWNDSSGVYFEAALALGDLLRNKTIEEALGSCPLSESQQKADATLRWVWKPFEEQTGASLRVIAGRIFYLLEVYFGVLFDAYDLIDLKSYQLDCRLNIPLLISPDHDDPVPPQEIASMVEEWSRELDASAASLKFVWSNTPVSQRLNELLGADPGKLLTLLVSSITSWQAFLLSRMNLLPRLDMAYRLLFQSPNPTIDDWVNVLRPRKFKFTSSIHYRIILALIHLLLVLGIASVVHRIAYSVAWVSAPNAVFTLTGVLCLLLAVLLLFKEVRQDPEGVSIFFGGAYVRKDGFLGPIRELRNKNTGVPEKTALVLLIIAVVFFPPALAYVCTRYLLNFLPTLAVVAWWAIFLGIIFLLRRDGLRKDRLARNPLHGVLDVPESLVELQEMERRHPTLSPLGDSFSSRVRPDLSAAKTRSQQRD
jgi:hypothetical protein